MIWFIRLYLLLMTIVYGFIGVYAIFDPIFNALELGYPSFLDAVGLSISSPLGYSEIAGIYGGLNLCIGIMCLVGIFKNDIGIFSIKFITFMVGSIAIGRLIFSALPSTPSFYSVYFLFEVIVFFVGLLLLYIKKVKSSY